MRISTLMVVLWSSIVLVGIMGSPAAAHVPPEQPYDWMYRSDSIIDVHLQLTETQKNLLNEHTSKPRTWAEDIGLSIEAEDGHNHGSVSEPIMVKAKLKGNSSFRCFKDVDTADFPDCTSKKGKAQFNLKFPKNNRPDGLKRLQLHNLVFDPSFIRETLGYEILRAAGIPAAKTGYARLWINGDYYGLYVNVEKYKDQFTSRWFSSTQHLYKGGGGDFAEISWLDVKEGDESDRSDVKNLAAAIDTGEWSKVTPLLARPDLVIRFLAAEWYIGHWDGYGSHINNYFIHSDDHGLFTMIPWDLDNAFIDGWLPEPTTLYFPLREAVEQWSHTGLLLGLCVNDQSCSNRFLGELVLMSKITENLDLENRVATLSNQLAPEVEREPADGGFPNMSTAGEVSPERAITLQQDILSFMKRRDDLVRALSRGEAAPGMSPVFLATPESESTRSSVVFEFGKDPSDVQEVTGFECRLDLDEFTQCSSPTEYENLEPGLHVFRARAINRWGVGSEMLHVWDLAPAPSKTMLNGAGAPDAGDGTEGDFYIDTQNNTLYGPKTGSGWGVGVSLVGPQGDKGDAGNDGQDGADCLNCKLKVKIVGPKKVKRGKTRVYRVRVVNVGNAKAKGVRMVVRGRGVKAKKRIGQIPAKESKTVRVRVRFKRPGGVRLTFRVASKNAGGKIVRRPVRVRR